SKEHDGARPPCADARSGMRSIAPLSVALLTVGSLAATPLTVGSLAATQLAVGRCAVAPLATSIAQTPPGSPSSSTAPAAQTSTETEAQRVVSGAREAELRGDLAAARTAWNEAARLIPSGPQCDECIGRGRALEIRLILRTEIAQAARADSGAWDELRMSSI